MRVAIALVAVLVVAGCGSGGHTASTVTVTVPATSQSATPGPQDARYFGQIVSLTAASGKRYILVLRPQSYLLGVTANTAFADQQGNQCAPLSCPGVEDDRLVVPAGSQPLTFVLPSTTSGTVLTVTPGGGQRTSEVSAAQLAGLVGGSKKPKLVEPLASGVWLAVNVDRITSFAQQFQP
jgi:hypothetical protein